MSPIRHVLPLLLLLPFTAASVQAGGQLPVSGEAVVLVVPDQVVVTLGIEVRQPLLVNAQEKFESLAKQVNQALTGLGIAAEQIRTDCLEIAPYYHENTAQERLVPEYYRINRIMTVTLKDPKLVDGLVSAALTAGATHVLDVDFRTTELRKYRDEARRLAIHAAKDKAGLLVGELGHHLGRASSIDEGSFGWYARNAYRARGNQGSYQNTMVNAGDAAADETLVPPGQIAVSANVRVTFEFD